MASTSWTISDILQNVQASVNDRAVLQGPLEVRFKFYQEQDAATPVPQAPPLVPRVMGSLSAASQSHLCQWTHFIHMMMDGNGNRDATLFFDNFKFYHHPRTPTSSEAHPHATWRQIRDIPSISLHNVGQVQIRFKVPAQTHAIFSRAFLWPLGLRNLSDLVQLVVEQAPTLFSRLMVSPRPSMHSLLFPDRVTASVGTQTSPGTWCPDILQPTTQSSHVPPSGSQSPELLIIMQQLQSLTLQAEGRHHRVGPGTSGKSAHITYSGAGDLKPSTLFPPTTHSVAF